MPSTLNNVRKVLKGIYGVPYGTSNPGMEGLASCAARAAMRLMSPGEKKHVDADGSCPSWLTKVYVQSLFREANAAATKKTRTARLLKKKPASAAALSRAKDRAIKVYTTENSTRIAAALSADASPGEKSRCIARKVGRLEFNEKLTHDQQLMYIERSSNSKPSTRSSGSGKFVRGGSVDSDLGIHDDMMLEDFFYIFDWDHLPTLAFNFQTCVSFFILICCFSVSLFHVVVYFFVFVVVGLCFQNIASKSNKMGKLIT